MRLISRPLENPSVIEEEYRKGPRADLPSRMSMRLGPLSILAEQRPYSGER